MTWPLTIVTGFLGAGKTTLINRLLSDAHGRRLAVLVNEFGEIDIDSRLIAAGDPADIVQLTNGCVCCAVQDDLIASLGSLLQRRTGDGLAFDHVVLETSGLADPGPIVRIVRGVPDLRSRLGLDGIVTVFDARHGPGKLDEFEEAQRQVGLADLILVNKADTVGQDELETVGRRIKGINGGAATEYCTRAAIDPSRILDIRTMAPDRAAATVDHTHEHGDHAHAHAHAHDRVQTFSVVLDAPFDLVRLQDTFSFLIMRYAERLLRYKGVLNVSGKDERLAFQGLHDAFETHPLGPWPSGEKPRSELVFIGFDLPEEEIRRDLAAATTSG